MIVHLSKEKEQEKRREMLCGGDPAYLLFHDVLKQWKKEGVTKLSAAELIMTAHNINSTMMTFAHIMEGIDDEMDDLEEEAEGEHDAMLIMMLAAAMLQIAQMQKAGFDYKPLIVAIYRRWSDDPLFMPFMDAGARKEQRLWMEGQRISLLSQELQQMNKEGAGEAVIKDFLRDLARMAERADEESIKGLLLFLYKYNMDHANKYHAEINLLYETMGLKSTTLLTAEEVVLHKSVANQAVVTAPGAVGFRTEKHD